MKLIQNNLSNSISKLHKLIPIKGTGSWIRDIYNTYYLDLTSGIGALSTGHSHPLVTNKVIDQIKQIVHPQQQIFNSHPAQIELTKKLLNIMPYKSLSNFFYTNSGSEATDNAIKIAKRYTNKNNIISITGGFHGRTIGALSVTSSNLNCKFNNNGITGVYFCSQPSIESFDQLLNYNTSTRYDQINEFKNYINESSFKIFKLLFGSGLGSAFRSINIYGIDDQPLIRALINSQYDIENGFFGLLFLVGILGFLLYFNIVIGYFKKYKMLIFIFFVFSFLGTSPFGLGHLFKIFFLGLMINYFINLNYKND